MLQPARHLAPARLVRRLVLLVLLGAAAVLIAPCKMVDDQLVDVSLHRENANICFSGCAKTYADGVQAETQRFLAALKACGENRACRNAERVKFNANIKALQEAARVCREACHHQGRGDGR